MKSESIAPSLDSCSATIVGGEDIRDLAQHPERSEDDSHVKPYIIQFDQNDPANPKNWSNSKKWYLTLASSFLVFNATFASSAPSGILVPLIREFDMSQKVGAFTLSLFVAGYCVGPLLWGPLSEQFGRRPIFLSTFVVYTGFQVGGALAKNAPSILVFRFLGGVFAAAPLTNSGALISDIWDVQTRGKALAVFTISPFAGPALGPVVAGFIGETVSWRWLFWVLAVFAGLCWIITFFTIPETYTPVLLIRKARQRRKETGDHRFYALMEMEVLTFSKRAEIVLTRPFIILLHEPMLIALTIYMSFVYGCLYLLFQAYPVVFTKAHNFGPGISGLMFLPIPVGGVVAITLYILAYNPKYEREVKRCAPFAVPPESRLEMALIAGPLFAISFFWFAWTSFPTISFWAPMMSGLLMGFSIFGIFLSLFNYIIDAYLFFAASALAANTVMRSLCGAAFPLFATDLYDALGPRWAPSLLGFVAVTMIPIPFVLKRYGPCLRKKSKYAPTTDTPQKIESSAV